jgi:trigger factor
MQANEAALGPLERKIDMAVPVADIDKDVEQRLKKLARTVKMPGFRPGKVPLKLVAQQYGPQVRSEAVGEAVNRAFGDAVRGQNFRVAGYPRIQPKDGDSSSHMEFSAVFEVYPEIRLADISDKPIERPLLVVGDAEVDKTIEVLRKQRVTFSPVERAAGEGDRVVIDFTGRRGGDVFQGGQATDYPVVLGAGAMLPDFEAQLIGASAGASKTFDLTFPADYHASDLADQTVQFEVTVKRVEAPVLPDVNEQFARALGIKEGDLTKMRSEVKANLEREVKKRIQGQVKNQVMNVLIEANPIDVPKALVEMESQQMAQGARQDLQNRGVDPKNVPVEPAWFVEQATRRVKLGLILAEIVKEHQLQAKPEQVRAMVDELAQSYEDPAEVVRWYYSQPQRLAEVEALVIENNVVDWVVARAAASDKQVSFDDLMGTGA